jgi:hypothetical protein
MHSDSSIAARLGGRWRASHMRQLAATALCIIAFAYSSAAAPAMDATAVVVAHLSAVTADLDPRAAGALAAVDGVGRRLLAARAYLRSSATLGARWSWSQQEIDSWVGSEDARRRDAAIARVRCAFELANPGYTVFVNPAVRTLEVQLASWNSNPSVARVAAEMEVAIAERVARPSFPRPGTAAAREAFRRLLIEYVPSSPPTVAAPGLSLHGRLQAVDFHVERDGQAIATPDASSVRDVWRAGGWERRLQAAVTAADVGFVGPLRKPDEPWHYELVDPPADHSVASARAALRPLPSCTRGS